VRFLSAGAFALISSSSAMTVSGIGNEHFALIGKARIGPFDRALKGFVGFEIARWLEALDLVGDGAIHRDIVLLEEMQGMCFGEGRRIVFGQHGIAVEQHDARLEVLLRLEIRIRRRIKRLDEGDLLGGNQSYQW